MTKKKGILMGTAVLALAVVVGIVLAVVFTSHSTIRSFANPNNAAIEKITLIVDRRSGELSGEELLTFTDAFLNLSGKQVPEEEAKTSFEKYLGGVIAISYRFSDGHSAIFAFPSEDENLIRVTVTQGTSDVTPAEAYFRAESKDFSRDSIQSLQDRVELSYPDSDEILPDGAA